MSSTLVWQLIKNNNSFLVKRGRTNRGGAVQFSTESGNLLNVNTFKYSGLAAATTAGISTDLVLTTKVCCLRHVLVFSLAFVFNF